MKKLLFGAMLATAAAFPLCGGEAELPIFDDDFSVTGFFAEKWNARGEIIPGAGLIKLEPGQGISPKIDLTGKDYAVEADISLAPSPEFPENNGHASISLDGITFMIRPDKRWGTAYRPAGMARSKGSIGLLDNFEFGKSYRFRITRKLLKEGAQYSLSVNGKNVSSFQEVMKQTPRFGFNAYRCVMTVDNVRVTTVAAASGSRNLAVNSSFEYDIDGMPPYYNLRHNRGASWKRPYEEFLKTITLDETEKHSGKRSVKLVMNESTAANAIMTSAVSVSVGKPVVGSVYLKSDKPSLKARLVIWELHSSMHFKDIVVTNEWKRYDFFLPAPKRSMVEFGVCFKEPGTLWADDIQVELGTTPTGYMASDLDAEKFSADNKKYAILPDVKLKKIDRPLVIDGDLSDFPADAAKVDAFFYKGNGKPKNRTEAYLACDDKNLYIAVRAFVPDLSKISAEKFDRDFGRIYATECIEIFLDPKMTRENYYQFCVNAAGSQADNGPGRNPAWNGSWKAAAKFNRKDSSIDYEMAFPYADFADASLSDSWCFNIGRNDTTSNEAISLTTFPQINFHLPMYYPSMVFPSGTLDPSRLSIGEPSLGAAPEKGTVLSGKFLNFTGKAFDGKVVFRDAAGKQIGEIAGRPAGESRFSVPVALPESAKSAKIKAEFLDGKGAVIGRAELEGRTQSALDLYARMSFFAKEKAAVIEGTCSLPDAAALNGRVSVGNYSAAFKVAPEIRIEIPLDKLSAGDNVVTVRVSGADGKDLASSDVVVRKLEVGRQYAQIDRRHRAIAPDGKPALMVAPFIGMPTSGDPEVARKLARTFAENGFKYVTPGSHHADTPYTLAFTDEAEKLGLKLIYWNFYAWRGRESGKPEDLLKNNTSPAIIALLVIDEPELYAKSGEVKTFLESYRKAYPNLPVFMNNTVMGIPSRFAGLATDIVMIDDYLTNREGRTIREMANDAVAVEKAGRAERKPAFFFPSGDVTAGHHRECSAAEQVAQCYAMVINGCTGLVHFEALPKYPRNWEAIKQVNAEFLTLTDAVFSEEKCGETSVADPEIQLMTRKLDGKLYLITLNLSSEPRTVKFRLPQEFDYADDAEVKFENRKVKVAGKAVEDRYKGMERHVYVVEIKK